MDLFYRLSVGLVTDLSDTSNCALYSLNFSEGNLIQNECENSLKALVKIISIRNLSGLII